MQVKAQTLLPILIFFIVLHVKVRAKKTLESAQNDMQFVN